MASNKEVEIKFRIAGLAQLNKRLRAAGFKPFEVELGGHGVGILENVPAALIEEFVHSVGSIVGANLDWMYWD